MLKGRVVGTLMSNYGLEKFFKKNKIKFLRANVGDRHVKEKMQKYNFNLRWRTIWTYYSRKICNYRRWFVSCIRNFFSLRKGKKASDFLNVFKKTPQILENIFVKNKILLQNQNIKKAIKDSKELINGQGRMLGKKIRN